MLSAELIIQFRFVMHHLNKLSSVPNSLKQPTTLLLLLTFSGLPLNASATIYFFPVDYSGNFCSIIYSDYSITFGLLISFQLLSKII